MKDLFKFLVLISLLLSTGCSNIYNEKTNATPQFTLRPTSEATKTPTGIPLPQINLELVGVNEHGGMVCLKNESEETDLDELDLLINSTIGGIQIESNIPGEIIEGRYCFEIMDSMYTDIDSTNGQLVNLFENNVIIEILFQCDDCPYDLSKQELDVGPYIQYPFLSWIFPKEIDLKYFGDFLPGSIDAGFHPALDFTPASSHDFPVLGNIPVYAPVSGDVILVNLDPPEPGWQKPNNIIIRHEFTGYLITIGHLNASKPNGDLITSYLYKDVLVGKHIAFMQEPMDAYSGKVHIHMGAAHPKGKGVYTRGDLNNFNFLNLFFDSDIVSLSEKAIKTGPP